MFLHDYLLACEISTVRTQTLRALSEWTCRFSMRPITNRLLEHLQFKLDAGFVVHCCVMKHI